MSLARGACAPRPGYTLFELILVLTLIAIVAALTFPSFDSVSEDARVMEAADLVRARWADARVAAMSEGRPYSFAVMPQQGKFRIAPNGVDSGTGPTTDSAGGASDGSASVTQDELPNGIFFDNPELSNVTGSDQKAPSASSSSFSSSAWARTVTFLPDGTSRQDVTLVLHGKGDRAVKLKLRALTGAVSVSVVSPGTSR